MSVNPTHHLAVPPALARDQAESLARNQARPDDGFWRDVFEQAAGQKGMAGAGVSMPQEMPDMAAAAHQATPQALQARGLLSKALANQGAASPRVGKGLAQAFAVPVRAPEASGLGSVVVASRQQTASAGRLGLQAGDAELDAAARPGGGASHTAAQIPASVVVTVAGVADERRVFLRAQGLTPSQALALASQAVRGADGAASGPIASVALNGQTIYSTREHGSQDAAGSSSFSITA